MGRPKSRPEIRSSLSVPPKGQTGNADLRKLPLDLGASSQRLEPAAGIGSTVGSVVGIVRLGSP
ncbi:MAG: hypothetical protein VKL01_14055 [Limnothrix sp.]|nr:hypothetical protein [Limnothrix sp.]